MMSSMSVEPGAPLFIVLNEGSGPGDASIALATIEHVLSRAGRKYEIEHVTNGVAVADVAARMVGRAKNAGGIVVAAGGDGTINAVTSRMLGSGCLLGVIPLGTFNYFCRTHRIPLDVREATEAVLGSRAHPIQVGLVNERAFLVNASLGLYPQLLEDREVYKRRYGRNRLVAMWSGLVTLSNHFRQLDVQIEQDGATRNVRTPTVFAGNNELQLEQIGMLPDTVREGCLTAIIIKPVGSWALFWLAIKGALGRLGEEENVTSFPFRKLTVAPRGRYRARRVKVATDGEIVWMDTPLKFLVSPDPLYLIKSDAGVGAER